MVHKGRDGAVELRCEFGVKPVAHFWVEVPPGALEVGLDEERRQLDDGVEEVLLGGPFVSMVGDGLFDVTTHRGDLRGTRELMTTRVDERGVQRALTQSAVWATYEWEPLKLMARATPMVAYGRGVSLAKRGLRAAVREAGGERHVFSWLHRAADGGLRAHLLVEDLAVEASCLRAMRAVAARWGSELVMCPGCTSETPYLVQGGALARLGLGELEGPVEKQLRERLLPPF